MPSVLDISDDVMETKVTVEEAAHDLTRDNVEAEPEIIKTYFPKMALMVKALLPRPKIGGHGAMPA